MDVEDIEEVSTSTTMAASDDHGPYQRFQVNPGIVHVLRVTVVRAKNLRQSKETNRLSSFNSKFLIDKAENLLKEEPDCYLTLKVPDTPNGLMRTKTANNQRNPEWNEIFTFYFNSEAFSVIEIDLLEANYMKDEIRGTQVYPLNGLSLDEDVKVTLGFPELDNVELELIFRRTIDDSAPVLRYSIELCDEETEFLRVRRQKAFNGLRNFLSNEDAPKSEDEVPVVAILGSGGGFRAMVGFSGAIQAINNTGLLDCTTYVAGLSGSTWYLSWLYSHPEFPEKSASQLESELQAKIGQCPFKLLSPQKVYRYMETINGKRKNGQPVSFTDLFGLMVGNTLIQDRLGTKLSEQKSKLTKAEVPLPLYTCIHVKKEVQARVYSEWLEFSPYEVGIPKYGAFMRSEHFGSIFYMGRVMKPFSEFPLHYMQGIWGSAFAVLFKQLLWIVKTDSTGTLKYFSPEVNDFEMEEEMHTFRVQDEDEAGVDYDNMAPVNANEKPIPGDASIMKKGFFGDVTNEVSTIWKDTVDTVASMDILNTLAGRAASIFNPLRGLEFKALFHGETPETTKTDDKNFKGLKEPMSTHNSTIYMVDGGLGFNSPYAILMRPQRHVQLYLSYDFSARPTDNTPPFKELMLAEQWARKTRTPFPPIAKLSKEFLKSPLRETYVFKDDKDPHCPIVVHFVLINIRFKEFKSPGVPRTTPEEKKFADFNVFDGTSKSFSTYNFEYSPEQFAQLTGLVAFNTLCEVNTIKEILKDLVIQNRFTQRMGPGMPSRGMLGSLINFVTGLFG